MEKDIHRSQPCDVWRAVYEGEGGPLRGFPLIPLLTFLPQSLKN